MPALERPQLTGRIGDQHLDLDAARGEAFRKALDVQLDATDRRWIASRDDGDRTAVIG